MPMTSSWPSGDRYRASGRAVGEIGVNGEKAANVDLPLEAARGPSEGSAAPPGSTLLRSFHEVHVPASASRAGRTLLSSTWLNEAG